jgi:hypothetical protein
VRLEVSGSVSLAERAELDRLVESWTARLLRFDLDDQTVLAPSADEIRELAERPGDPIISRVAAELVAMLEGSPVAARPASVPAESGPPAPDVIRRAIHILHSLVTAADADASEAPAVSPASRSTAEPAAAAPAPAEDAT